MTGLGVGLVLGGGGARGAYEAGVLRYVAHAFPHARFDVITGTSAGAINAAWLAAHGGRPGHAPADLAGVWERLCIGDVYRLRASDLLRPAGALLGLGREVALLDTRPLQRLVREIIPWGRLGSEIRAGGLRALAVTGTELATSRNIVWVQGRPSDTRFWQSTNPYVRPRPADIGPEHVLASAAIPFLFPPVQVDGGFYVDGGLGQQTPLRPALRLGVDRLLVISLRRATTVDQVCRVGDEREGEQPTWSQVVGKTMTSVLLDMSAHEVERLRRTNRLLAWGEAEFGPGFAARVGEFLAAERGAPWRHVEAVALSPRQDLGELAVRQVEDGGFTRAPALVKAALRGIARAGTAAENDVLSFLLFDSGYLRRLVALGQADAASRHDELEGLFTGPASARGVSASERGADGSGSGR